MLQINPEIVEILKQRWEPPKVFENVLSADDIAFLLDQEENNPQKKTLPFRVFGLNTEASFQRLKNKLDSILVHPYKVTGGNFFRTEVPYRLHADTGIDEFAKLYRIVVFPLFLDTGADPYLEEFNNLTIMNQRWYNQAAFFMKGEEDKFDVKKAEYNQPVNDYSIATNITTEAFPKETFDRLFNHLVYKNFEGFSELVTVPWRIGNAITFDRSNIHTASNFLKANVKMKIGLTFFTEYADI
jgi:hypothetical protein